VPGHEVEVKSLFTHSLVAAAFAQEIARSRRWNVEEAFLCGLLHDVGKPVLWQELIDLHRAANCPVDDNACRAAIGVLHARIGAELVRHWALPARLGETIMHHHDPAKSTTAAQTALMTCLADDLAHLTLPLAVAPRTVTEDAVLSHHTLEALNLYPDELEALLALRPKIKALAEAMS
jgi:putative nucleotidyltransferase with HDIG domain